MNDKDKQKALIELGSASMNAMQKAIKENTGLVLSVILYGIRASYQLQAEAIIRHTTQPNSGDTYVAGPNIGRFKGIEVITIKGSDL